MRLDRNIKRAAALAFTTPIEEQLVRETLGFRGRGFLEPCGVDLDEFEQLPPRGGLRKRLELSDDRPIMLFLSRIHYKKGLDLLIPAFAQADTGDAVLVIAGPGEADYIEQIQRQARDLGVSDRVLFTGMLYGNERIEAMVDADFFVLPSYQENFGIVVIEALAASLPVLISDQVNVYPMVQESETGVVVPTQVGPLAARMEELLADPTGLRAMAERGRPYVWEHFDWNRIGERWRGHYQTLLPA